MRVTRIFATGAFIAVCSSAHAVPVTLDFVVSGFGVGAPTDPVSGTIVYEAAALGSTIDSLTSVSLTVGTHSFTLADTLFVSPFGGALDIIYGTPLGLGVASVGPDDFWLRFDRVAGTGFDFFYTTADVDESFQSYDFTEFSLSTGTVPEPGIFALLAIGSLGLGITRRKADKR